MIDDVVIPFPSPEDREVDRLVETFWSLHAHDPMVKDITARMGLRTIIEDVCADLDVPIAPSPIDAGLLQLYYLDCLGVMIPRNVIDYYDWCANISQLKSTDPAHAAALEEWGTHHFYGIILAMLDQFLEQERA